MNKSVATHTDTDPGVGFLCVFYSSSSHCALNFVDFSRPSMVRDENRVLWTICGCESWQMVCGGRIAKDLNVYFVIFRHFFFLFFFSNSNHMRIYCFYRRLERRINVLSSG